ncbi:hypothetical protein BDN72DRAFT_832200 [Pluteus cervinus]|uniref:Uncharacterized protein n=1 Tax=Pluteus cervinus TaxID=181527 RepID=A0ACD3BBE5_9AGAR|nr:hypothetical protein BDN72DRAFT_832200 [Pluteus cervinus]
MNILPIPPPLPAFLDPALDYLYDVLPSPVYSFVVRVLSHSFMLLTSVATIFHTVSSTEPAQWNMQTLLPPLISLLVAYFALISIYRTTSWAIRTTIWFIKWGTILAVLVAGYSWSMGTTNHIDGKAVMNGVGGAVLDAINSQASSANARKASRSNSPPRSWDSFEDHKAWRAPPENEQQETQPAIEKIVREMVGATDKVLQDGWWGVAKSMAWELSQAGNPTEQEREARRQRQSRMV